MRKIILLSSLLVSSLFAGCAAEVEIVDDGTGVNKQFVEGAECIEATLPANGCLDYGTLKTQVYEICLQADMQLTGLNVDTNSSCNNGSGTSADVEYQCCPAIPQPPEPPAPPKPEPEPGVCTGGTLGDGTCQSYADFKMAAWELCKQAGADLVDLVLDPGACPDGETGSGAYKCCTPAPQPPPVPGVCTTGTLGDGTTCQYYGDYKLAAWEACNQAGATLYNVTIETESCGDGEAKSMTYVCLSSGDYCP